MNEQEKQYFPGLDLLKFILALLIISAHCHLFSEFPSGEHWWGRFTAIAIPLFFGISSYLFFRKVYNLPVAKSPQSQIYHTVKRLAILFSCWYLLMLPVTYFRFYSVATWKETVFAIFLSCCFNGYWFIKALIINTTILFLVAEPRC
jgi:peptidoglycan/LPS O-acetylase OafA/YrhL